TSDSTFSWWVRYSNRSPFIQVHNPITTMGTVEVHFDCFHTAHIHRLGYRDVLDSPTFCVFTACANRCFEIFNKNLCTCLKCSVTDTVHICLSESSFKFRDDNF